MRIGKWIASGLLVLVVAVLLLDILFFLCGGLAGT